ncbi:MAG: hypothetical protein DRP67_02730 [Candidatus Omnitrophota bacterium]|nr:MAG: hypothetical protein DRP67_02730 [Candidatus Omnitrophota bacterium]
MLIIPAIDLKKDKIVRLYKGKFEKTTFYEIEPEELVRDFITKGTKRLHIVLLSGAKDGIIGKKEMKILEKIIKIRNSYGRESCKIQLGGGIRRYREIEDLIEKGVDYIILGTALLIPFVLESGYSLGDIKLFYQKVGKFFDKDKEVPEFELIEKLGKDLKEKIIVAIDYKDNEIGISGWEVTIPFLPEYVIENFKNKGFKRFLLTDIERDGTLEGIEETRLFEILRKVSHMDEKPEIIVSGGVSGEKDIETLINFEYPPDGVVIGKAIYQGQINLRKIIQKYQKIL